MERAASLEGTKKFTITAKWGIAHFKEKIKAVVQTYVAENNINIIPRTRY